MSRKEHTIDHIILNLFLSISLFLSYTIQSRVYMLISRSLHRTIRNISSLIPSNFQNNRSISTKMATSQTATIPQAQRMFDGGTHKLDVWSIFTYVSITHLSRLVALIPCSIFILFPPVYTLYAHAQTPAASSS